MDRRDATLKTPIALTIAGSDSGAGAGIQADLKTFAALGVYGACVVTALTAQNTKGVRAVHLAPPEVVAAQIDAVLSDFNVAAVKIGMLGSAAIAQTVEDALQPPSPRSRGEGRAPPSPRKRGEGERAYIVYDPVMAASSGAALSDAGFIEAVGRALLPRVDCLTPNLAEAAALLGQEIARTEADMVRQGRALIALGPRAVLMKGGHLPGDEAVDLLVTSEGVRRLAAPRRASTNLHGTGCTLSSAIAAHVVLGKPLWEAVAAAKAFVGEAIEAGRSLSLGVGPGPLIQTKLR
ncbi:MAG TPA: hydroxymethylpyrimidine/phosphomethylpyrimidine kinase [Roseiarcus sp.]|nr:hydroxymethylpyrimidine/phosphomethylpyrimidine kinase [Roseiarcus sp.]